MKDYGMETDPEVIARPPYNPHQDLWVVADKGIERSMEYVRFGRTGLKVSRICLGTNMYGAGYVEDGGAVSVIKDAFEQGINFIDTADVYNSGRSEEIVGRAVKDRRHDF